ncbi:uncharacterized protein F4807DRAFT_410287 [Annulohypoxylon truncatum]|uniref:uncharacterized protein n=1 Tax=Annulohypoxylon truncatum TaxID=327061 RepID=UPI00200724A2|nr:uncharacterized protein F4807DRAFT_410287 [Annulohypoxylon truncatum]KAI1213256.1 hypothetical protein F4807DRAFT_410287 [Annulohypoxylon truncatum]
MSCGVITIPVVLTSLGMLTSSSIIIIIDIPYDRSASARVTLAMELPLSIDYRRRACNYVHGMDYPRGNWHCVWGTD